MVKTKMRIDHARTQLILLSAQYTLKNKEIIELEKELRDKESAVHSEKMRTKLIVSEIAEELSLKSNWGYDPITGEIKDE